MTTRTIAIGLPDNPSASAYDILCALRLSAANLGSVGDFASAAIVANLMRHITTPFTEAQIIQIFLER